MKLLETITINENNYSVWYSNHIALRSVLSIILKNFADQLDKKFIVPTLVLHDLEDAQVIYISSAADEIIGGICFRVNKEFNMGEIFIVFKEGTHYTKDLHEICVRHFKSVVKEAGMTVIIQHVHVDNHDYLELARHVDLKPTYYFLSQSLVDNDQE
jgi:hypothetical protein